jgi:hypothetical protein
VLLLPLLLLLLKPILHQQSNMQQLQAEFPEQYNAISANRFRSGTDMQFAAAYKWYAAHTWAVNRSSQQQQQQQQQHVEEEEEGTPRDSTSDAAKALQFVMLKDHFAWDGCYRQLDGAWRKPGVRFVCLNDNKYNADSLLEINRQTVQFLNVRYSKPSEFELPEGASNGCGYLNGSYGTLPSAQDVAAACIAHQ